MESVVNDLIVSLFIKNPIFWIIIILGLISIIFYKKIIGKAGEFWVRQELNKLNSNIYKVINDITIIVEGVTHQIDHIVVSKLGIFVIETKQYNGYIKGNEYDKKWIQNNKIYINNPIHQNYGHIKSLEKILDLSENKFISIVCIPSTAKVNVKSKSHIARIDNLNKIILSYTCDILPDYNNIYNKILSLKISDKNIEKQHINRVKQVQKEKFSNYDKNACPLCGGTLVKREGKYGKFIGCSNYPKCRYTRK